MTEITIIEELFAPLAIIVVGLILGVAISIPAKKNRDLATTIAVTWGTISGIAIWVIAFLDYGNSPFSAILTSVSALISSNHYAVVAFGGLRTATSVILIGLYEVGLVLGFSTASNQKRAPMVADEPLAVPRLAPQILVKSSEEDSDSFEQSDDFPILKDPTTNTPEWQPQFLRITDSVSLETDEKAVLGLFLLGNTQVISPHIDATKPEGYYLDGTNSLQMDTNKLRQLLDSLAGKNVLVAELTDKLTVCRECGSPNLQLRNICPDCKSMKVTKHDILEHTQCGRIDRREAFLSPSGDLVCPNCRTMLRHIGSDYRRLPPKYACSECNALNYELLQLMKCNACGTTLEVDEESERYLYSYSLKENSTQRLPTEAKPVETCSEYFKGLGYTVVAPAFVEGKSGSHLFDLLFSESSKDESSIDSPSPQIEDGSTVVEVLVSPNPIRLEQLSKVYEKMIDVQCNTLIFAIPSLDADARRHAMKFKTKVVEGRSMQDALQNSGFSSIATSSSP